MSRRKATRILLAVGIPAAGIAILGDWEGALGLIAFALLLGLVAGGVAAGDWLVLRVRRRAGDDDAAVRTWRRGSIVAIVVGGVLAVGAVLGGVRGGNLFWIVFFLVGGVLFVVGGVRGLWAMRTESPEVLRAKLDKAGR